MENIYSHKATANEIKILDRMTPGRSIEKETTYANSLDTDLIYADLFRLYCIRGDKQKAIEYFNKIKDEILKFFLKDY